jgi:5-formyltetrahydrofolate cyclo-ligase
MDKSKDADTSATTSFLKDQVRKALIEQRLAMPDRLAKADLLQRVMRIWLVGRPDTVIGAYWPIKGEFDPLPCTAGRKTASSSTNRSAAASGCR